MLRKTQIFIANMDGSKYYYFRIFNMITKHTDGRMFCFYASNSDATDKGSYMRAMSWPEIFSIKISSYLYRGQKWAPCEKNFIY